MHFFVRRGKKGRGKKYSRSSLATWLVFVWTKKPNQLSEVVRRSEKLMVVSKELLKTFKAGECADVIYEISRS